VIGKRRPIDLSALTDRTGSKAKVSEAKIGERPVYFDNGLLETAIYERRHLPVGAAIAGPAVIEQSDSTVLIEPGTQAIHDDLGNLMIEVPLITGERQETRGAAA